MEAGQSALEAVGLEKKFWQGKKVFLTGHSGFKGSWFVLLLQTLGAQVTGLSLSQNLEGADDLSHFKLLNLQMPSYWTDIRNAAAVQSAMQEAKPEIVFHLAAQALVKTGYQHPAMTYDTNVMGTVHVLESVRHCPDVKAVVIITTDKCYENKEWVWPYREVDVLGGHDPYSSSKACAELVTQSWRRSFFAVQDYGKTHQTLIASARAGNVIGGGDWSHYRLIPDLVRAWHTGNKLVSRCPQAVRPWQHVLESVCGYMLLAQKLYQGAVHCADAYNFGPDEQSFGTVQQVIHESQRHLSKLDYTIEPVGFHEANQLRLDSSKAKTDLGFAPVWDMPQAVEKTVLWYRNYYENHQLMSLDNVHSYLKEMEVV